MNPGGVHSRPTNARSFALLAVLAIAGCAADLAVKQSVSDVRGLSAAGARLSLQVLPCINRTEYAARDIGKEATRALLDKLGAVNEFDVAVKGRYVLACDISTFVEGSAFKRWLMPGWGATTGQVAVMVTDSTTGETVAIVRGHATVAAGGLYSVDADRIILSSALDDVVQQLRQLAAGAIQQDVQTKRGKE
jgi:outer membrane murein-binding lipoprotein Lpp